MNARTRLIRLVAMSLLLLGAAVIGTSCSSKSTETASNTPPPESTATAAPALSDANIAAIVLAANDADIANGKQALGKSKDADVKSFAQLMVTDHAATNDKAKALATKLSLTPEDNETSNGIKAQQDSVRATLKDKTGADFNKAYVDNEVSYHETVLGAIDQALIPNAQNPELKQLLTDTRPVVAAHLDHAKQIQAKLSGTAAK